MTSSNVLLAKQPIYNKKLDLFAYELLYRPSNPNESIDWDGDTATAKLLLNALLDVGLPAVTGGKKSFVNFSRNSLLAMPAFDPRFIVIEVLETVEPDDAVIRALQKAADQGFTIALDDFTFHEKWLPLLELAHIVKVDVIEHQNSSRQALCEKLREFDVQLLAEKVETYEVFEECQALGFDYFQGYFFSRPQLVVGGSLSANKVVLLQLLADLRDPEVALEDLEASVLRDVSLSVKVLRLCNSLHYASHVPINSVRQAILLIGIDALRQWASIIALSSLSEKPPYLLSFALTRARTMELLAGPGPIATADSYFTVGIFSLVDAFFDRPKEELLENLPFDETIRSAILEGAGHHGLLLESVKAHEMGRWDIIDWPALERHGIGPERLSAAYLSASQWADDMTTLLL